MASRVGGWFGIDADWERLPANPRTVWRSDLYLAALIVVLAIFTIELMRSAGMFAPDSSPLYDHLPSWFPHLLAAVTALPLAWRRRFPIGSMLVVYALFLGTGLTYATVTQVLPLQIAYFMALYSAVAWARDRRAMLIAVVVVVVTMFGWIGFQVADASVRDAFLNGIDNRSSGLVGPWLAFTLYQFLVNIAYFGAAIVAGLASWHAARRRDLVADQTATIDRQNEELREHAVLEERLRIARELHDVVAHHVSVTGVQAAAARRTLTKAPDRAAEALAVIEKSARSGVEQMRGLVRTLRSVDDTSSGLLTESASTANLAGIAALVNDETDGLNCTYQMIDEPRGALDDVPGPIGAALYRVTQEALNNVRKHSTARGASVTLRADRRGDAEMAHGWIEVEVLDGGRPRPGTSGSGLGLVGIRERAAAHEGTVEIGPRHTGGYRVRVRIPLPDETPIVVPESASVSAGSHDSTASPAAANSPASAGTPPVIATAPSILRDTLPSSPSQHDGSRQPDDAAQKETA